ncbi:hypothetical protein [Tuberibacillus sp. Marseille-P3662]|uniref:hypothetical protein n=1 Tax=Tuberibacillus sp. Marseille-P3662 TaxID=1965358 RepID=UPI00111C3739|nr:hypothetical protein [Tuberibacillus sp. Marseille-P3662]
MGDIAYNAWFVLISRSLGFLFLMLAAAILISLVNPVLTPTQIKAYEQGIRTACQSSSLIASMVWQTMDGQLGGYFGYNLMQAVTFVSFGAIPFIIIGGVRLRKRLEEAT